MPITTNSQVTDTVSQTAMMTLGASGSVAQGLLTQGFVAAMATAAQAAVAQQDATQILADAALAAGLKRMAQTVESGGPDGDNS